MRSRPQSILEQKWGTVSSPRNDDTGCPDPRGPVVPDHDVREEAGAGSGTALPPSIPPTSAIPTDPDEAAPARAGRPRRGGTLLVVLVILLVSALVKIFVIQNFEIPSSSMEDTLMSGDRVAVTMYDSENLQRGDVVVFVDPDNWLDVSDPTGLKGLVRDALVLVRLLPEHTGHHLIKRVIGLPGDHVVADGQGPLTVNGVALDETYLKPGVSASSVAFDVTVPAGYVWVMGDNRSNSADSRAHQNDSHHGFVPISDVVGVAQAVVWPVTRWGGLDGGEQVFSDVPAPTSTPTALAGVGSGQ